MAVDKELDKLSSGGDDMVRLGELIRSDPRILKYPLLDKGRTPLHDAVDFQNKTLIEFLLSMGADLNVKTSDGFTPLDMAACYGKMDSLRILIAKGANWGAQAPMQRTPKECADKYHQTEASQFLESLGTPPPAPAAPAPPPPEVPEPPATGPFLFDKSSAKVGHVLPGYLFNTPPAAFLSASTRSTPPASSDAPLA